MWGLTLVRSDARKRELFARNGVGMQAVSRAPLNKALCLMSNADRDLWSLQEARSFVEAVAGSLPDRIQVAALTLKSKIPFKALSVRETLLHRVHALASAAVELFEGNRVIPAVILARAVVESTAVMFTLHERTTRFLQDLKINELDDFLMRNLVGARNNPDMPTSINILTLVDRVEKAVPGFRSSYDSLCECAHPNWAGTLGAYGAIDPEKYELKLGPSGRTAAFSIGVHALSGALMLFHHYYNDSAELMLKLNDHFEQAQQHDA